MDTFTLITSVLMMMIAFQFGQNWIVFGVVAVMILTSRDLGTVLLMFSAMAALYLGKASIAEYWPVIMFGLIILALFLGIGQKPQQPELYPPDPYGGLLGGM